MTFDSATTLIGQRLVRRRNELIARPRPRLQSRHQINLNPMRRSGNAVFQYPFRVQFPPPPLVKLPDLRIGELFFESTLPNHWRPSAIPFSRERFSGGAGHVDVVVGLAPLELEVAAGEVGEDFAVVAVGENAGDA